MTKPANKPCTCGSTEFYAYEIIIYDAELINNILEIHKDYPNGLQKLICKNCDKVDKEINYDIEFI